MAALARRVFASCSRPLASFPAPPAAAASHFRPLSTVPSLASASTPAHSHPSRTSAARLPGVIYRYISVRLHNENVPASVSPITLPNPFYKYRVAERPTLSDITGRPRYVWMPPAVNVRRQKILLDMYFPRDLPPSTFNPQGSREVEWVDGRIIQWETEVETQTDKASGPYAGRKVMFKGHKDEREKKARESERNEMLAGMEKRVDAWRKSRAADKVKGRSTLPF